jgi:hypothetical protein
MGQRAYFRQLQGYPDSVSGPTIVARLLDGLGFRFYWATEGLSAEDYRFSPSSGCYSIGQLVGHIWGLINWIALSSLGFGEERPSEPDPQRESVLRMLRRLRDHFAALSGPAMTEIEIDGHPFWHLINGPMADALTHVGQINSFRRLAGHPAKRSRPFTGLPPATEGQ